MKVEGKGTVAPARIDISIPRGARLIVMQRASLQAKEKDYRSRRDGWGEGLLRDFRGLEDLRPEEIGPYVGMIGEWGVCLYLNRRLHHQQVGLDLSPRVGGDWGIDFEVYDCKIQVKTRTRDTGVNLVRRTNGDGWIYPLASEVYVFCQYLEKRQGILTLLGFAWAHDIVHYPLCPARRGIHENFEIPDCDLRPMTRLVHELRSRKELL